MKIRKNTVKIIYILLLLFLLPINIVQAEDVVLPTIDQTEATALTITPSVFEGVVTQGNTTTKSFELKNNSHVPLPIKCYIRNFDASDEEGGVAIPDEADAERLSPRNWINVVTPDFVLQPQTSHEIVINFNTPKDLPPGGYYAILFAEPLLPESFLDNSTLQIGGRLGSLLFLVSPGDISETASIASVDFPHYIFSSSIPELKIRFKNEGNVHLRPSGKITIENVISRKNWTTEVPEFTVLPGKIRQLTIAPISIKWPGIYKAKIQLSYGKDKIMLSDVKTFYYLPIVQLVTVLITIGFILVLLVGKTRKRIIKALKVIIKDSK